MADNVVDILLRAKMEAGDVASGVGSIQKALNGLSLPKNISGDLEKSFGRLGPLLKDYQKQLDKGFKTSKDLKNLELLKGKISDVFGEIKSKVQQVNGQEIRLKTDTQAISKLEKELDGLQTKLSDKLNNIYKSGQTGKGISQGIGDLQRALSAQFKSGNFKFPALKELTSGLRQALDAKDFAGFNNQIDNIRDKINSLSASSKFNIADSLGLKYVANDANSAGNAINTFLNKLQVNKTAANSVETLRSKISETGTTLQQLKFDSATRGAEALGNAGAGIDQMANALLNVNQNASSAANGILSMQQQVDQLKTSTQYFFSLRNMINLLRRGVSQAVDTIKELDAAMTQTAVVVPEWDVGDMWAKLPEYTQNANKLGSTVVDLYKATTLYYQQGLRGNEVMDIAAETMKMARIGGLEAADATDKMTAALRGFNMEISATSAQRVNDVYSNLAANTASNTEELGTAMQRTASIAASAGMSFEGTAAFLAQAIETTREPAENLGTAMKTIVARFTELKKNPLEIAEVDGEEVSYNKVDAALQSIGVSLKDANGQFRNLDQVFLDISQRWDNLTQTQQRYVATQAAGSRQQSRFIAMMSNYQRTTELMDFANNSEGASQEQFEKTMESLEAKMNKLKNAWDAFLMGITDNQIVKGAVDGLTGLVDGVNKLIDALSLGVGPLKSFMSLMTAFVGLKMGGRFINSAIGGLGGMVDPTSSFSAGFKGGMVGRGNPALASQIYNPIVAAIHELGAAMGHTFGNGSSGANSLFNKTADQIRYDAYKSAHQEFKNMAFNRGNYENKNATVNDLTNALSKLDTKDQNLLGKSFFNTTNAAKQAIFGAWAGKAFNYDKSQGRVSGGHAAGQIYSRDAIKMLNQADKAIYANVKDNSLPLSEYFKRIQDPTTIRQALEGVKGGTNSPVYGYFQHLDEQGNKEAEKYINSDAFKGVADKINNSNKLTDEQKQAALNKWKSTDHAANAKGAYFANLRHQGETPNGEETFKNSPVGKALDHISGFGSSMASAGMGLRSFGSLLQQSANPAIATFGTALTTMGSLLSGVGMGITGLTSAFSSASASIATATNLATGAAAALTAGLFGLVAVVGLAIAMEQKRREDIKKRAEEITTNYKDKSKETTSNISNLQSWQEEMPRLAKGVDKNGNNINLEDSDYQQYLEIADSIAEMNPEIVKGYNEQGHAIVDNNTALQKTLELQKKNQKLAVEEYTSDDSIRALIEARDLNKTTGGYTGGKRTAGGKYTPIEYQESMLAPQQTMIEQAKKMSQTLAKAGLSNKDFKDFGIDLSALEQGNQEAITILSKNIDKIKARAKAKMQELGDEVSDDTKEAFDKSVSGFTTAAGELDEMVTPIYDALSAKMAGSQVFQDIPDDMVTYFNQGLKTIASDSNLGFDDMMHESRDLANEFANLTAKGSDYDDIMADIEEAQHQFGKDLDAKAYKKTADEAVSSLEEIKDGIDSTTSHGQALTEFLDNQIAKISSFTEEGAIDIADALNTMTDEISAAEGALESFKKVEEGSNFSTAAKSMKEIYDTITSAEGGKKNEHAEGEGDQTYWAGAETLFGRDTLKNKRKKQVDAMLKSFEPMLKEGQEGYDNFKRRWLEVFKDGNKGIEGLVLDSNNLLKEIDMDANPEAYKQIAEALGMSEDFLTSMLNKGRQFGEIDFKNLDKVREGLATSDQIIAGQKEDVKGKKNIYMKEEALNAELANAGITSVKEQEDTKRQLEKEQGIKVITKAAEIGINEFKDMGIHSQESLIATLDATGQYTKEEIQDYAERYAERYAKVNKKAEEFNKEDFDAAFAAHEAAKDPVSGEQLKSLQDIDVEVASIADMMANQRIEEGHLDGTKAKEAQKMLYGKEKGADTEAQYFAQGKNVKGELISPEEYKKTSKSLDNFVNESQTYVDKLKEGRRNTKAGSEERKKYDKEIAAFEQMIGKAKEYREKGKTGFHNAQDEKISAINAKTGNFLAGKTWKDFKGTKNQNALQDIYEATLEPKELTKGFRQSLKALGMTATEALESGLITEKSYKKFKEKAKKDQEDKNNAEQQGEDEANAEDKEKKKEKGKKNQVSSEEADRQAREESERKERERNEAARKAKIAAEQRDRENAAKAETAAAEKEKQEEQKKQQQKEAAEKARIAAEQRDRENAEKLANIESNDAFGQYTPEEAQQAGQNLKDWWGKVLNSFKMDTSKNMLGFSSKDIDTSGLDNAVEDTEKVADGAKGASEELDKDKNSVTSIVAAVTSGLSSVNKGVKTFSQNAQEASSSPSLQGEPKQKGTTVPGVGYVDRSGKVVTGNGKGEETPKPDVPNSIDVTVNFKTETSELDAAKASINQIYKKVAKPATVKVKASTGKSMTNAVDKISEVTTAAKNSSGDVKVKANVEGTQDVKNLTAAINKVPKSKTVTVTAITEGAVAKINALRDYASKPVSFTVDVKKGNKRSFNVTVEGKYLGQNNTGIVPQLPSLGSAATGTSKPGTGRLGPKGKGGLTLTGELGYEVAWLPREHRSMILGVRGPEMVNLPGDAVVWNHKQSEQIIKKNAIPSGSAWVGAGSAGDSDVNANMTMPDDPKNPKKPKKPKKTKDDKDDKDDKKKKNKNKKEILLYDKQEKLYKVQAKLLKKQGKINTWWENISKRIAAAEKIASRNQKRLEKLFSTVGTTKKELDKVIARYGKFLTLQVKLNNQVYNKYNKQLQAINYDENGSNKSRKKTRTKNNSIVKKSNAYNSKMTTLRQQLAAAEETESKKDDKRIKKRIRRLKKKYKDTKKAVKKSAALQTVTWEQDYRITYDTNKKKNKKKNKKVKKSKTYDFSKFVYQDPETGEYLIDYKKINKKGRSKAERKAMKETAEKLVNEKNSRRNDALEKQISANEALEELGKNIYNNLYGWKNELTKIWNITQKIATTEASINKVSSMRTLYETALKNGLAKATDSYIKMGVDYFQGEIAGYAGNVKNAYDSYNTLIDDLAEARNLFETQTLYNQYYSKLNSTTAGKNIMKMAQYEEGSAKWEKYQKKALKDDKNYDSAYEDYGVYRQLYNSITARNLANQKYIKNLRTLADGSIDIEIDYAAIEKDRMNGDLTETTYNAVKEYIDNIKSISDNLNEQLEAVISNLQQLNDQLEELQEQYADYADELLQIYEDIQQAEVDKLEAIYNTLNDHIKDLLDKVKKNLDNRRQKEDNEKTEEDINNKQQRLARLRANTSGGNRAEIAQLEKEIADAQQSYGRTLEDQLLARLEEQADEAAKQREIQIKLLNAQLQINHMTGVNAAHIDQLLQQIQSQDANESAAAEREIRNMYNIHDEFGAQTKARQIVLSSDQEVKIADLKIHDIIEASINAAIGEVKGIQTELQDTIGKLAKKLKENVPGMPTFGPEEEGDEGEKEKDLGYEGTFKNAEAIAAQQATIKKTDSRIANQYDIIYTIRGNYSKAAQKIEDLQNKNDIIKRKMSKLDPKSKEYKNLKNQYNSNKDRIDSLKEDQENRKTSIKQHEDTITTLEKNKTEQIKELSNLNTNGTKTNFTLEETQGILDKLGMALPEEFSGLGDLTAVQSKVISTMSAQQIAELTGLSKVDAEGFSNIVKAIAGIKTNVNITVDKNGNVKIVEDGTEGGGNEDDEELTKEQVQNKITELSNLVSTYISNRDDQKAKAARALENRNSLNKKNANYSANYKKWTDSYDSHIKHANDWEAKRIAAQKQLDEYRKKLSQFAEGGFAKFTGPAWLDGTRAKPEAVLSATDTKNFIQLKDILSDVMGHISNSETSYGNVTYDIDVNVERLASDYDVDKVAKRIEKIITKDASYRNVTQVRKFR